MTGTEIRNELTASKPLMYPRLRQPRLQAKRISTCIDFIALTAKILVLVSFHISGAFVPAVSLRYLQQRHQLKNHERVNDCNGNIQRHVDAYEGHITIRIEVAFEKIHDDCCFIQIHLTDSRHKSKWVVPITIRDRRIHKK